MAINHLYIWRTRMIKDDLDISYSGALEHSNFGDRLNYLSLAKKGYKSPRRFSNPFYHNPIWRKLRDDVIARDGGYDLGIPGIEIKGDVYVHHIIPIEEMDIEDWNEDILLNPDNLITCSHDTHMAIHYKNNEVLGFVERQPGDTKLW